MKVAKFAVSPLLSATGVLNRKPKKPAPVDPLSRRGGAVDMITGSGGVQDPLGSRLGD